MAGTLLQYGRGRRLLPEHKQQRSAVFLVHAAGKVGLDQLPGISDNPFVSGVLAT